MLIAYKSTTGADWQAIRYSINNETFNKVVTLLKVSLKHLMKLPEFACEPSRLATSYVNLIKRDRALATTPNHCSGIIAFLRAIYPINTSKNFLTVNSEAWLQPI